MTSLFLYNWEVRDEWFAICGKLPLEDLLAVRAGGVGSILKTLFHIVDIEYSWIRVIQNKTVTDPDYEDDMRLESVKALSQQYHNEIKDVIMNWPREDEEKLATVPWRNTQYTGGEILRHVIAHEIHHAGQLSVWARELGVEPPSANVIGRCLNRN